MIIDGLVQLDLPGIAGDDGDTVMLGLGQEADKRMNSFACVACVCIALCGLPVPTRAGEGPARVAGAGVQATSAGAASLVFEAAQLRKDVGTLDRMLAPDYVFVHGSGKVGDRRDFLAAFGDPAEVFTAFDIVDRRVIAVGRDGAIVAAEARVHGVRRGVPFMQHFRYDDTYVCVGGAWQVVYTQVTALPP